MEIDNSTLRTYADCRIKAMLSHVLHRKAKTDGESAWFGKQFHKFVEHYWQPGEEWKNIAINYDNELENFLKSKAQTGKFSEGKDINPEIYRNCIKQFVVQVPKAISPNGDILLLDFQTQKPVYKIRHRPEISFQFPLGKHAYVGRLDTLVEDFNSQLWVFDIKTTGKYNRNKQTNEAIPQFTWEEQFRMSTQFSGYIRALQYHTDKTIAGAIVIAIPRAMGKLKIPFIRIRRTNAKLEQWEIDTVRLMNEFARDAAWIHTNRNSLQAALRDIIPTGKYSGCCTRFGVCEYMDICDSDYNLNVIEQSTIFKPWSPLEKENENE